jgi:iron complex outermembrane receptor protein
MYNIRIAVLSLAAAFVIVAAPAIAQNSAAPESAPPKSGDENALTEIVITASRGRNENVQTTPIAVTALSAQTLEQERITDITNISSLAPNLQINRTESQGDVATFYLRGFGAQTNDPAVDPHVAVFIDGIYQPALFGTMIDLFDIEQVEVLAGPQGTLLGKNAPVGAIAITTAKPTGQFGGEVEADYGSYDHVGARFKLNVPLIKDVLAAKISFVEKHGGDWVYDTYTNSRDFAGEDARVARLALAFTPSEQFTWNLTTTYLNAATPQPGNRSIAFEPPVAGNSYTVNQPGNPIAPGVLPTNTYTICLYYPHFVCPPTRYGTTAQSDTAPNKENVLEAASSMVYRLTPITLTSVTGFYDNRTVNNAGVSGTQFDTVNAYADPYSGVQTSEEFRVSSNKGGGWDLGGFLDWVVGGYYQNYHYTAANNLGIGVGLFGGDPTGDAVNDQQSQHGQSHSWAGFSHLIFNLTDQWTGTFGVRYSSDYKEHDYVPPGTTARSFDVPVTFDNTSIEIGTAYQFDSDHMAYVRFAQGYQAGGFTGFPSIPGGGSSYKPETNNSYEIGFKSDWLNKRLRANIDFFLNQISQLQVESAEPNPVVGFIQVTDNAGSATVQGIEAQITAVPVDALTLRFNVGYLDPTYNQYHGTVCSPTGVVTDCSGIPFEYSPRWTIDLGSRYVVRLPGVPGSLAMTADWNYRTDQYVNSPPIPGAFQDGYGLVSAGLMWLDPSEKYSLEFYGTNLLNREYKESVTDSGGLDFSVDDGRPREWGIRVRAKFGQ